MSNLKRKFDSNEQMPSIPDRLKILNRKLSLRPDRHQLIEQGILHDSQCAPRLQHAEQQLKRARLVDQLNTRLSNRPGPMDLIEKHILHLQPNSTDSNFISKTTERTKSVTRPLIFHEYTSSPTSSKPKITKIDSSISSSSSTCHQIRLAQQQLYLELTSTKSSNLSLDHHQSSIENKPLEQLTLNQLKELCRYYHLPCSHANKSQLIQRISNHRQASVVRTLDSESRSPSSNLDDSTSHSTQTMINEKNSSPSSTDEIEYLSPTELDEILRSFPPSTTICDDENFLEQFFSQFVDPQSISNHQDDLFVQMLLESPSTSTTEQMFDELTSSDHQISSSSPLPRITTLDEFDAFLRDFTTYQTSNSFQQISTSTN